MLVTLVVDDEDEDDDDGEQQHAEGAHAGHGDAFGQRTLAETLARGRLQLLFKTLNSALCFVDVLDTAYQHHYQIPLPCTHAF